MKKFFTLCAILLALILEIIPYGAVCNFMTAPGEPTLRLTYSYFDLTPFGYANFAPFIVAILTCILLVLAIAYMFVGRYLRIPILAISAFTSLLSIAPLLFGVAYYSWVGLGITLCLICASVLVAFGGEKAEE